MIRFQLINATCTATLFRRRRRSIATIMFIDDAIAPILRHTDVLCDMKGGDDDINISARGMNKFSCLVFIEQGSISRSEAYTMTLRFTLTSIFMRILKAELDSPPHDAGDCTIIPKAKMLSAL